MYLHKYLITYFLNIIELEKIYKSANLKCTCDKYLRETSIQGRKLLITRTFLVRQLFKGDNYSREETIRGNTVLKNISATSESNVNSKYMLLD